MVETDELFIRGQETTREIYAEAIDPSEEETTAK